MARHSRVALVGGGGKSTLLYALAKQALDADAKVLVCTTTHMWPHPGIEVLGDRAGIQKALSEKGIAMFGVMGSNGKVGAGESVEDYLGLADVILTEADGSRGLPLKAPAAHEPVIPAWADAVIAVAGLDCLARPISQACHRPEQVCALLGKETQHLLTPEDVADVLSSPHGGRKDVAGRDFRCGLNKADDPRRQAWGEKIKEKLKARGIRSAVTAFVEKERGGLCWF